MLFEQNITLNVTRNLETKHKIHSLQHTPMHNHTHLYTPQCKTTHAGAPHTPTHPCTPAHIGEYDIPGHSSTHPCPPAYTQTHLHTLSKTKENLKLLILQKVLQKEEENSRLKHLR